MVKTQTPPQQISPSAVTENQPLLVEPIEAAPAESAHSAFTNPVLPQEFFARVEDTYYTHHWGINE